MIYMVMVGVRVTATAEFTLRDPGPPGKKGVARDLLLPEEGETLKDEA